MGTRPLCVGGLEVIFASIFALAVVHGDVLVTPIRDLAVDVGFVRMQLGSGLDELPNDRLNGGLLDVGQHPLDSLTRTHSNAENSTSGKPSRFTG